MLTTLIHALVYFGAVATLGSGVGCALSLARFSSVFKQSGKRARLLRCIFLTTRDAVKSAQQFPAFPRDVSCADNSSERAERWRAPPPRFTDRHQVRKVPSASPGSRGTGLRPRDLDQHEVYVVIEGRDTITYRSLAENVGCLLFSSVLAQPSMKGFAGDEYKWRRQAQKARRQQPRRAHAPSDNGHSIARSASLTSLQGHQATGNGHCRATGEAVSRLRRSPSFPRASSLEYARAPAKHARACLAHTRSPSKAHLAQSAPQSASEKGPEGALWHSARARNSWQSAHAVADEEPAQSTEHSASRFEALLQVVAALQ